MNTLKNKVLFLFRWEDLRIAYGICITAVALLALAAGVFVSWEEGMVAIVVVPVVVIGGSVACLPAAILLAWLMRRRAHPHWRSRSVFPLLDMELLAVLPYGLGAGLLGFLINPFGDRLQSLLVPAMGVVAALFGALLLATLLRQQAWLRYLAQRFPSSIVNFQEPHMDTVQHPETLVAKTPPQQRFLVKGLITGSLILAMLIPTVFINNLVKERESRHKQVATEVGSKWSSAQTLSGPYLYVPYRHYEKDKDGKILEYRRSFWLLPEDLNVDGQVSHEIRKRSIYQVLLYRADLATSGRILPQVPADVDPANILWKDARICMGISDFKGIEEKIVVQLQGQAYELSPGLPDKTFDKLGLSAVLQPSALDLSKPLDFSTRVKLKGSESLHFNPLSGNSRYTLRSSWPNPSFDGNSLPGEKQVSDSGFQATWTFNKANLPFNTLLREASLEMESLAFGVTLLQPADNYAKTERSVKYAILFIGLTFSLFFIVEILQKKPVHPVQYVLIGLALVIFYTLLLSISEFLPFDYAYLLSGSATILLITLYAWSHFRKFSSAALFASVLSLLYAFIFVLIRLEDTALLVGSVALFFVLALVMYASRNIRWYAPETSPEPAPVSQP